MKSKLLMVVAALALLMFTQGCECPFMEFVIWIEYCILDSGPPVSVMELKPSHNSTWEIYKGTYNLSGILERGLTRSDYTDALFPTKLIIILERVSETSGEFPDSAANVKKLTIRLKMNKKTGNIKEQQVKIKKDMIIDPARGESLRVSLQTKNGICSGGDRLTLQWEQAES